MLVGIVIADLHYKNTFHTYDQSIYYYVKGKRPLPSKIYMANWIGSDKKSQSENYRNLDILFKSSGNQTELDLREIPQLSKEN